MKNIYKPDWQQELINGLIDHDITRKKAYICSPLRGDTAEQTHNNMCAARAYMFYAIKTMSLNAAAPHAFLPLLLCDDVPAQRAIALKFGQEFLEQCDIMLVCGNTVSSGMKEEITKAAILRMPIIVFHERLYLEVKSLTSPYCGDTNAVKLDRDNFLLSFTDPQTYLENVAMFK